MAPVCLHKPLTRLAGLQRLVDRRPGGGQRLRRLRLGFGALLGGELRRRRGEAAGAPRGAGGGGREAFASPSEAPSPARPAAAAPPPQRALATAVDSSADGSDGSPPAPPPFSPPPGVAAPPWPPGSSDRRWRLGRPAAGAGDGSRVGGCDPPPCVSSGPPSPASSSSRHADLRLDMVRRGGGGAGAKEGTREEGDVRVSFSCLVSFFLPRLRAHFEHGSLLLVTSRRARP